MVGFVTLMFFGFTSKDGLERQMKFKDAYTERPVVSYAVTVLVRWAVKAVAWLLNGCYS